MPLRETPYHGSQRDCETRKFKVEKNRTQRDTKKTFELLSASFHWEVWSRAAGGRRGPVFLPYDPYEPVQVAFKTEIQGTN